MTAQISIGSAAGGWVAYGILVVLLLVYVVFTIILFVKFAEAFVRILGRVGFDRTRRPMDSGLIGVLGLLGCFGGGNRGKREHRQIRPTEVQSSLARGGSITPRDSSSFTPPNVFVQHARSSVASQHSTGQPPSVLRPEQALKPYREDSDDDDESTQIMGAWQPFPSPGSRPSCDRSDILPLPQPSPSGFSRVSGGRAHFNSPYAIAGATKAAGGSTLTFPSVEKRTTSPLPSTGSAPKVISFPQENNPPTPSTSVANVARLPVLTSSGAPQGAAMPHIRTKSQTAIIVGELAGMPTSPASPKEFQSMLSGGEQRRSAASKGSSGVSGGGNVEGAGQQQPKKKGWFNIRRNRRHSDGQLLDNPGGGDGTDALNPTQETGKSFVVIRDKKPLTSQPRPNPQRRQPSYSLDGSTKPSSPLSAGENAGPSNPKDTQ